MHRIYIQLIVFLTYTRTTEVFTLLLHAHSTINLPLHSLSYFLIHIAPYKYFFFFFNEPPPTEIYPLPQHDALPIPSAASRGKKSSPSRSTPPRPTPRCAARWSTPPAPPPSRAGTRRAAASPPRARRCAGRRPC